MMILWFLKKRLFLLKKFILKGLKKMKEEDLFNVDVSGLVGKSETTTIQEPEISSSITIEEKDNEVEVLSEQEIITLMQEEDSSKKDEVVVPRVNSSSWEDCLKRMNQYTKEAWICLPRGNGKYLSCHVDECTNEEFLEWVNFICPSLKGQHEASDYLKSETRHKTIVALASFFTSCKFPKGSGKVSPDNQSLNKKKDSDKKKKE